jgi:acyl-CoA synthetase (NDP forming)
VSLDTLFYPASIAVVGASQTPGKIGYEAMKGVQTFPGSVVPVNPNAKGEILGESVVASVADIDERIDLALLCVPAPVVPDVLADCAEAGIGGAVSYAGGFAESGEDGERLQERIAGITEEYDIRLLGPNTSGFVVPQSELFASFASGVDRLQSGSVAVIAQSGGVAHTLAFRAIDEGWGLSAMVGLGNRADVGFTETIAWFDAHEDTDAIVLHVEGTDDARGLLETCEAATTPIVAYNVGEEDVGTFAESHTGALTGEHALYEAGFHQYGVPTVDSTSELLDAGYALANTPAPSGTNVGVVTAQAGPGIIIADRLLTAGATLPELSQETNTAVSDILPDITYAENPIDTGRPMPAFGEVVAAVTRDPNVDCVLVYELHEDALGFPTETLDGLAEETGTPLLFATNGPSELMADDLSELEAAGVPVFRSPERGADATTALVEYARLQSTTETEAPADD